MDFPSKSVGIHDEYIERIIAGVFLSLIVYDDPLNLVLIALEADLLLQNNAGNRT